VFEGTGERGAAFAAVFPKVGHPCCAKCACRVLCHTQCEPRAPVHASWVSRCKQPCAHACQ
jgi:hypothetical protein